MISSTTALVAANAALVASHAGSAAGLPLTPVGILFLKAIFALALIGMVLGGWIVKKASGDLWETLYGALLGFLLLPCVTIFISGIAFGIYWVFTA